MAVDPAVLQRLDNTDIGVVKLDIFSDKGDCDFLGRMAQVLNHLRPVLEIRFWTVKVETLTDNLRKMLFLHGERSLVQILYIQILEDMVRRQVAEQRDLVLHCCVQRIFRAAHDDVRLDSHSLEFFYTGLRRFCLHFLGGAQIGDQRDMDQNHVLASLLMLELADGLKERLALDIADGSTHLDDGDLRVLGRRIAVETALDLICDVRDDLHCASAEISAPFFQKDRPVDLSCSDIGILGQALIDESLVVSEIEIGLSAVVSDKNLSVLYRVHCARVNVDIRIELLHCDGVAACFQKTSQRSGGDAFSESGDHAACNEYIFYCHFFPPAFV